MRVTIIPSENRVNVEGQSESVDCSSLDQRIRVVQWYGSTGEIEFWNDPHIDATLKENQAITEFAPFQRFVDAWEVEAQKVPNAA